VRLAKLLGGKKGRQLVGETRARQKREKGTRQKPRKELGHNYLEAHLRNLSLFKLDAGRTSGKGGGGVWNVTASTVTVSFGRNSFQNGVARGERRKGTHQTTPFKTRKKHEFTFKER